MPRDPRDEANIYLEIRAGTGGDEAALFAGDLFRMYMKYAEQRGWQLEVLSASEVSTAVTRKSSAGWKAAGRIRG